MKLTGQSEYLALSEVLVKPVQNAFIREDKIASEWQALNYTGKPDFARAKLEYEAFMNILVDNGARVKVLPLDQSLSLDALYCRDSSIVTDQGIILCNMGKAARKHEPEAIQTFLDEQDFPILGTIEAPGTLEGGDVAWLDQKTLAVGLGYRTNKEGIKQLKKYLNPLEIEVLAADLPHYKGPSDVFHLMSILSPVDKDLAVVYSPLMPVGFRNTLLEKGFSLVEVPEAEFDSLGCNVLALGPRKCLMVRGNPITEERLYKAGCEVLTYSGEEISIKGGGGPTCLTRPLSRELVR